MELVRAIGGIAEPITLRQVMRENPTVSFSTETAPELLAEYDVYPLTDPGQPDGYDGTPQIQYVDGQWTKTYPAPTAQELEKRRIDRTAREHNSRERGGVVFSLFGGLYVLPTTPDYVALLQADITRVTNQALPSVARPLIKVESRTVVSVEVRTLTATDLQTMKDAVEEYLSETMDALTAAVTAVLSGDEPDYQTAWETATGAPQLPSGVFSGATGPGVALALALYDQMGANIGG